jgi:hypothetical protein
MSNVIAEGVVVVEADASGIPRQVASEIEGGGGQAATAGAGLGRQLFGGVLGAWAAIGGAQAVTGYFTGAISGASDLNETMSKSAAIFGDSAGAIEAFGSHAAQNIGLSKQAAMDAAAGFGDMFTQIGFTSDSAASLSQQVLLAAADLGSFSNLETADVADRMSAAFRGEYDSLQAVIPNINAARVESEALAATGKKTASELTAQEKATAVLAIVQKDGARAMGDFARTSDGAANSAKIASASLEDQSTKLGSVLLPIWSGFLSFLNTSVIPAFSSLVTWITQNTDLLGGIAMAVGVAAGVFGVLTVAVGAYNAISGIFKAYQIASAAATGGLTFAQWALNAAMSANPIGLIITLLALLVGAIVWVATQTTFFQDVWSAVMTWFQEAWANVSSFFTTLWTGLVAWFNGVITNVASFIVSVIGGVAAWWNGIWTSVGSFFTTIWNGIRLGVATAISVVRSVIVSTISGISSTWSSIWSGIGSFFSGIWSGITTAVRTGVDTVVRTISGIRDTIGGIVSGIGTWLADAGRSLIQGFIDGISGMIGAVGDAVGGIMDFVGGFFPHSPAKWGPLSGRGWTRIGEGGGSLISQFVGGIEPTPVRNAFETALVPATAAPARSAAPAAPADTRPRLRDIIVNEAEDPLGSAGRVGAELRKWGI